MKKIANTKILKKAIGAVLSASIALGSALVAMPVIDTHAVESGVESRQSVGVDMALGLGGLRDPVTHTNSSGESHVPSDYIYFGDNNRGAMLWRVLSCDTDNLGNEGAAFVMSEYLEAVSLSGKSYDEAYLSYFTDEEKAILVPYGTSESKSASAYERDWTEGAPSGYLFAPSASDVSRYVANYSGAPALRAYTDASRATSGNWWLRSELDGGVGYVSVAGVVDTETNVEQVSNYNRIAANLDLSDVVFSTRVDGGWRLALLDKDYDVPVHEYDFAAWITDVNGNDVTISYVNAKPKDVSDDIREMISAIITDAEGNVKHYAQMGEVSYTEEKQWYGWSDFDKDGTYELLSPAALYPYHGSVHLDISGDIYDHAAGDKIYVFWEKAYSSRDIDANPNLAYQTTTTSKLVEVCWHEADPNNLATCTRFDTCIKCETQFGEYNFTDISAHVDEDGNSGIVWEHYLGQYRGEDGFFRDGYVHFGYCELCKNYLPIDENGYVNGAEPCFHKGETAVDCTNGAVCAVCGNYFTDPMMHSYLATGVCNRHTHFEEPLLNREEGIYEIKTVGNLIWYAQYVNSLERGSSVYGAKLIYDIDFAVLQNYPELADFSWTPIGVGECAYSATFDGNGKEIRNLRCVSDQYKYLGFIANASGYNGKNPTVKNLGLVDCYFENTNASQGATAALVAFSDEGLTVEKCYVKNTTVKGSANVGGVVGVATYGKSINHCYAIDLKLTEGEEVVKSWIIRDGSIDPAYCFAYGEDAGILGETGTYIPRGTYHLKGYNCYYLADGGTLDQDNMKKTEEQFRSGLVAYYLGSQYGQTIGTDNYPVLGGEYVYRVDVCGGTGFGRYTYSNTEEISHVWNGEYACGEAMICSSCGLEFGEVLEHEYTKINGEASFIWVDDGSYSACAVQTYCVYCDEKNPELLPATVNVNFNGGVRADYVATVFIGETKYSSEVVRKIITTIDQATGIYPSSQMFTGQEYLAAELVTNTKMQPGEYEAYFLLDGEMVGESARAAGVYDLYIVGQGRYAYQEYTYEDFFTIEAVEVEMTVTIKDKIVNGTQDYEFELSFSNGVDYSELIGMYADQYELHSWEVGEYEITGIDFYFYYDDENSITITFNNTATARILPRNYVEIINDSYKLDYEYGESVPEPLASNFTVDEGSELTFTWFKNGVLLKSAPQGAGTYTLRVFASATDKYIASSVEYTVTVQPKYLDIVIDPNGECETEIEDLGYDLDDDGKNDERVWYLVEMGKRVPIYVVGLPGTDEPVAIDDERFTSTGFYIYWRTYQSDRYSTLSEGNDYAKSFPAVPYTDGYRIEGSPYSENTFGVSTDVGFGESYNATFFVKVKSPGGEVKPVQDAVEYNGEAHDILAAITVPRWDVEIKDYDGSYGYPDIDYYIHVGTSADVDESSLYWHSTEVDFENENSPVFELTFERSGIYYMYADASYTIYTGDGPIEDHKELVRAKLTVTVTDAAGNAVDEIKDAGAYTITIKTEPCDVDGNVTGKASEHSATYRVKAVREIYMLVKEMDVNLDGTLPKYDPRDVVFLTGYTLAPGHRITDLTYNVQLGGYAGAMNMGIATVRAWVIVDEDGDDVSDEYIIYSELYEWNEKYEKVYGEDYENTKNHTVVHAYSNACDATCNIDDCTKTREVEPHRGGEATCTALAICEVCGSEYGGYDHTNHSGDETVYVRNPDDYRKHDKVYACCGAVLVTEEHTETKAATCTTLAECEKCGVVEGSYDADNHSSEEMYYATSKDDETKHEYLHKCCDAVESIGTHAGGKATCTALAICDTCNLCYGELDADNHSSEAFTYTAIETSSTRHNVSHDCCGAYVGTDNHFGGEATCTSKAICEGCGAGYGDIDPENHASDEYRYSPVNLGEGHYIYNVCCGAEIGTEAHSGGNATCISRANCEKCGAEHGELDPDTHASEDVTYRVNATDSTKHDVIAACCGAVKAAEEHSGGGVTCTSRASCEGCGEEYGDPDTHTYSNSCDADCDVCGAGRLPGHVDADKNKVCDECEAKLGSSESESESESEAESEIESETQTETESGGKTDQPTESETKSEQPDNNGGSSQGGKKKGCGSALGASALLVIVSVSIVGFVSAKKKKED